MIETKDIIKMVKKIVSHDKGVPDTRIMHPMREWLIGLIGVTIAVAGGSLFALFVYNSYSESSTNVVAVTETVVPYKAGLVEQALEIYLEKKSVYEGLIGTSTVSPVIDTSVSTATSSEVQTEAASSTRELPPVVSPAEEIESAEAVVVPDLAI